MNENNKQAAGLTLKFAGADLGLISSAARYALSQNVPHTFLMEQYQQLTKDAPESARRIFGEELSDELKEYGNAHKPE